MATEVLGFFDDSRDLGRAINALIDSGFTTFDVTLVSYDGTNSSERRSASVYIQELQPGQTLVSVRSASQNVAETAYRILATNGAIRLGKRLKEPTSATGTPNSSAAAHDESQNQNPAKVTFGRVTAH